MMFEFNVCVIIRKMNTSRFVRYIYDVKEDTKNTTVHLFFLKFVKMYGTE